MRRIHIVISLVLSLVVAACAPDAQPTLHDLTLYGLDGRDVRYSLFYGAPTSFELEGETLDLTEGRVDAPFHVPAALLVDGEPYLTTPVDAIPAPVEAARIPLTTSLQVRTHAALGEVAYFDGEAWLTLLDGAAAGLDRRVAPRPRIGRLRGMGALTSEEADALADFLEAREGPLVVASLPPEDLPERSIDGLAEYRRTGLYVQDAVAVDPSAFEAPPEQLAWEVLAQGNQAVGFDTPTFRVVESENELLELWNRAHGGQLSVPPVPTVDFARETVVAVFQGERPTGGYGIEISDAVLEGDELFVQMRFQEPAPDAFTTQALTSPWAMVRVLRGGIDVAWFRNPTTGELLGVARGID